MKKSILLLLIPFCCFFSIFSNAQKSQVYTPSFWMYNFISKDTLSEKKLNSHLPLILDSTNNWFSRNKTKKSNSLFVVYKANNSAEDLVSIIGNKKALFIKSNTVSISDTTDITGYNELYGELLDVRFGDVGEGIIMLNNKLEKSDVFEIILDNNLTNSKINEVRTYLSLKYGVDLIDYNQYTYKENKLWQKNNNNDNIFGIGKFTYFNLFQTQSTHSKNSDFKIKFSNDSIIKNLKDGEYVLIGDNSKKLQFQKNKSLKKWSIQSNVITKIDIELNDFVLSENENSYEYYLLINGIKYAVKDDKAKPIFENILIDKSLLEVELFRNKLDFDLQIESNCDFMYVKLDSEDSKINVLIKDQKSNIVFNDIYQTAIKLNISASDYYDIEVKSKEKKITKRLSSEINQLPQKPIEDFYELKEGFILISPKDKNKASNTYTWFKDQIVISNEKNITLKEKGNYRLVISNSKECEQKYDFQIFSEKDSEILNTKESWQLYPNPSLVNKPIKNTFDFFHERQVQINIFSLEGKLVKSLPSKKIKNETIVFDLPVSGTYMVVAYIDDYMEIKKIIIE